MKQIFFTLALILCLSAFTSTVHAQIVATLSMSKETLSSTDTSTITVTADDYVRSYTAVATKTSGTVAGKVYFYGSGDGTNYDLLDSITVANVATAQYKTFSPSLPLKYYKFKINAFSTGGVWTIRTRQLKRQR